MKHKRSLLSRLPFIVPPAALALITAIVYYPSLHYNFQFDDIANIQKHFDIRHYGLRGLFFSGTRWISYWLNSLHYQIGRFDPFSYRVGNMLIHISNGILVFFILTFILSRQEKNSFFQRNAQILAIITSLLFLIHPVQTQTISYVIQGQLEGMAMLSILGAVYCFLHITHTANTALKSVLTFLLFVIIILACGTKEITIVLPALLILVDWFFIARGSLQSIKKRLFLHGIIATTMVGIYVYLLKPKIFADILSLQFKARNNIGNIITQNPKDLIQPLHYFISQFKVIVHYLWIFIWPFGISVEYDWKLSHNFFSPDAFFPFLFLAILVFFIFTLLRRNPTHIIGFGALWFMICTAPRSTIIPSPELLVDYKTYTACFGWLFLIAAVLIKGVEYLQYMYVKNNNSFARAHYMLFLLLAGTLGGITIQRNTVWRSGLEFWSNIIENAPGKARAYNNYGVELSQNLGKYTESMTYFKQAISMDQYYPDPLNNLAVAYAHLGKTDDAIIALKKSLKINPYYPEGYNNIASFFLKKKDYKQAQESLEMALKLRPHYGKAFFNLGRVHFEQGEKEKGWEYFRKCCMEGDLDNETGFIAYAKASIALKKYDDAIFAYKKILSLNPHAHDGEFNLANAYFIAGKLDDAQELYEQLAKHNPQDGRVWYNLGETHFKRNNTDEALDCFERARTTQSHNPQLYIRIAACQEKKGNPAQAKQILHQLLTHNMSESVNSLTQGLINKLNDKYKLG